MWRPRFTMSRPRFKTRRIEDPDQDPHWQNVKSPTSSLQEGPPPTSLCLAREVSASHDLPPAPTGAWAMTHGVSPRREHHHQNVWGNDSPRHANTPAGPNKSLNAGLSGCTSIPSTSSPTLPHASSAWGTRAPPTTSTSLDLGPSVVG
jgi:hypothetical protein